MGATAVVWAAAAALLVLPGARPVSGQSLQKPQLVPAVNQTLLQPGDTLTVTCRANQPVVWNGTSLDPDFRERRVTEALGADGDFAYVLRLQIHDVSYLDVGYQRCHYVGDTDADTAGSVYLFVNDTENLLVWPSPFMQATLGQDQRGVIPCRPSHPRVKVTLKNVRSLEVSFDPTEGFIVPSPSLFFAGSAVCTARLGAVRRQLRVLVVFNAATVSVQQPNIDTSDARRNAVLGFTFSLQCSVNIEVSQGIDFTWQVPPASTGLKTGRITEEKARKESNRNVAISRLEVKDTRQEDAGNFTCLVKDHNGHTNSRTVHVTVYSPNVSSVKLRTDARSFPMGLGQTVKIVVNVESRPAPIITWLDPENREIITAVGKYHVVNTNEQTILHIFDLRLNDMGQYRVKATASYKTSTATDQLTFTVTVRDKARIQLAPARLYHVVGEQYRISCVATGYPRPSLEWRFEPCDSSLSCPPDDPQLNVTRRSNDEQETQLSAKSYRMESDLTVTARRSGVYWCYANNSESDLPAVGNHLFYVSDIAGGFGIQRSNASVIEGDNVTMVCGGSVLDFPSPSSLSWRWSDTDTGPSRSVMGIPGVQVRDQTTEYSHRRVLVLDPVQMGHAGLLICSGTDVWGELKRSNTSLGVTVSQKPVFTAAANMDQSASLHVEEGDGTELNCTVTGQPAPRITWTKSGEPLRADGDRVLLLDGDQRLEIATVLSSDAGSYECQATNREGTVRGSAELLVPEEDTLTRVVVPIVVALSLLLVGLIACLVWKSRQEQGLQKRLSAMEMMAFDNGRVEQINPELPIEEQVALLPYAHDEWEFPKDRLVLGRQIGSGAFGRVLKAEAIGLTAGRQRTVVAVKMPRSGSDPDQIRSLMSELKIMIQLGKHLNVVNLLGAVTRHAVQGEFMVLVEYCRHGNLHQYLHRHKNSFINQVHPISGEFDASLGEEEYRAAKRRDSTSESCSYRPTPRRDSTASSVHSAGWDSADSTGAADDPVCQSPSAFDDERARLNTLSSSGGGGTAGRRPRRTPLTTRDLLRWSYQVARGMDYLASRKLLHGDLAARNVLLAEDNIVKISDFGLSRDIYKTKDYRKKGKGLLPVKWMAIESIQESLFSTQSDVWAFGVVLWELFSLGATPYPGMEYDVNFVRRLRDGYRMEAPKFSPHSTYQLMLDCWRETPGSRPSFTELSERLGQCLEEQVKKDYIRLNEPYQAMNVEYFMRRVDYVNTLASPDYQNVSPRGEPLGAGSEVDSQASEEPSATVWPDAQAAAYTAPIKGGGPTPLVDSDSYLLISPGPEQSPDSVFSPRPDGVVRQSGSRFEFPPPPQLAGESPPPPPADAASTPNGLYNPSYHEAGRAWVPSTPKMGTRVSRPARPAAGAAETDGERYRALGSSQLAGLPVGDEQRHLSAAETGDAHYRVPMPVGCEQLA